MAKSMGLAILPLEVLEVLVTYLSAADLARCLGVSRTWYDTFNNDIFWKRHCSGNWYEYFSKTKCLVEPGFKIPTETQLPISKKRLQFLQEQHLLKNWNSGRFKREEIVFDCDDSISYNIKVSFLDNDHLCLHRTFETEVWNVAGPPFSIMIIPYCLNEMWEVNMYKVVENNLVVIQCNVVQIYKLTLASKSWSLDKVFFYNKPENFSSDVNGDTDVGAMFQLEGVSEEIDFERVFCGQYFVGAYMGEESPILHIWDLKTGKKLKEARCEICVGRRYTVALKACKEVTNKVLVTFTFKNSTARGDSHKCCSVVYDLSKLQFDMDSCRGHSGDVMYFDGYISVADDIPLNILHHYSRSTRNETVVESTSITDFEAMVTSIQPLGMKLLISTRNEIYSIDPTESVIQNSESLSVMKLNFTLSHLEVLFNKFILLHDSSYQSVKELWQACEPWRKVLDFPPDSGTFVSMNDACSKIVLERGNTLFVLNFW